MALVRAKYQQLVSKWYLQQAQINIKNNYFGQNVYSQYQFQISAQLHKYLSLMFSQSEYSDSLYIKTQSSSKQQKLRDLYDRRCLSFVSTIASFFPDFTGFPSWDLTLSLYLEVENSHQQFALNNLGRLKPFDTQEINLLNLISLLYCTAYKQNPIFMEIFDWDQIACILFNRHWKICRSKWLEGRSASLMDRPWTKEEDEALTHLYNKLLSESKVNKWRQISLEISQICKTPYVRLGKQCRERWMNKLNPEVEKGPWYKEEECQLLEQVLKHGKRWSLISRGFFRNLRTENTLKNRYNTILKRESSKLRAHYSSQTELVKAILAKMKSENLVHEEAKRTIQPLRLALLDECDNFQIALVSKKGKIEYMNLD